MAGSPLPSVGNPFSTHSSSHSYPPPPTHTNTHTRTHPSCYVASLGTFIRNLHLTSSSLKFRQGHRCTNNSCSSDSTLQVPLEQREHWRESQVVERSGVASAQTSLKTAQESSEDTKVGKVMKKKKPAGISHQLDDKKWKHAQDPWGKYPLTTKPHPALTSPCKPPPPLLSHLPTVSKCFLWPEWNLLRGAQALWRKHN